MIQYGSINLNSVRVADLTAYLVSRKWKPAEFARKEELKYVSDIFGMSLLIPANEQLSDYVDRVEMLINSLSELEERPFISVISDIITPACDKIKVRLSTLQFRTGTLHLGFAVKFFQSVRNMLIFAECANNGHQTCFTKATKKGIAYADQCRLSAIMPGSFQAVFESPLTPPASELQKKALAYPNERRLLLDLMTGLQRMKSAHESGDMEPVVQDASHRINANICDSILDMKPDSDDATIDFCFNWDQIWPIPDQPNESLITFDSRSFETIKAISQAMRAASTPVHRELIGKVISCSSKDPIQQNNDMVIVMLTDSGKKVEVQLSHDDYRKAVNAHIDGKNIRISGTIEKYPKKTVLRDYSDFDVVHDSRLI
ncbi:MAG: hypothetical protein PHE53_07655 [Thermoguttaceae bacterium]|nr:hypothetical protein [Thermoguttaceae bacterium]